MSILIELEAVLNVINEAIRDQDRSLSKVKDRILALPTIEAEPKHGQMIRNAEGVFVPFTCSCWHNNPTEGDKFHNGNCTKNHYCIRTRENDPYPTKRGKTHKTYCGAKMDEDWEEPEINPCRGCTDYNGRGGCKSNGGCGRDEAEE